MCCMPRISTASKHAAISHVFPLATTLYIIHLGIARITAGSRCSSAILVAAVAAAAVVCVFLFACACMGKRVRARARVCVCVGGGV